MSCAHCHDRGVVFNPQILAGHQGALEVCDCVTPLCRCGGRPPFCYFDADSRAHTCPCRPFRHRLRAIQQNFNQAEIPSRFQWKFRQNFLSQAPDGTPITRAPKVRSFIDQLVQAQEKPGRGLFLYGHPGTGKSLLGAIILNELMLHRGKPGRFISLSRGFFHRLRDTFSEDSERHGQAYQILEELVRLPYVVLDDLGVQRGTEWEEEVLYDLVDGRYAEMKFTIVTTNVDLSAVEQLSQGRIYSRLVEMCHLIEMDGPDWRKEL